MSAATASTPEDGLRLVARAYGLAARLHAGQTRKGRDGRPYVNHVIEVAEMVAQADPDPETVAAAVLHDALEDSALTRAALREGFGERVAALVAALTDAPDWAALPRAERKACQARELAAAPAAAQRIKLADQTSNLRDLARDPGAWEVADARDYIDGAARVVAAIRAADPGLAALFDTARAEALAQFEESGR